MDRNPPSPSNTSRYPNFGGSPPPMADPFPLGNPFALVAPSEFSPGTHLDVIECFRVADQDGSGFIDGRELQNALSSDQHSFSLRAVHLLMYLFTNTNSRQIGPKEFTQVFYSLQSWRSVFDRHDRDKNGKIDSRELKDALLSLGYPVSPLVLDLLVLKFETIGGDGTIQYDSFIECYLTVKGLTDKFKAKVNSNHSGSVNLSYEEFMLSILPFIVA